MACVVLSAPATMAFLRLPKTLDLSTQPTRNAFLETYSEQLQRHGQAKDKIQAKLNAVRWLFSTIEKPPHTIVREDYLRFMTKVATMGARPARLAALRFAIHLAFDQMCGHRLVTPPPKSETQKPPGRPSAATLSRDRLIACLADELGLDPREIKTLRWKHISLDDQLITLPARYGSGRRRVALTKKANAVLLEVKQSLGAAQGELFTAIKPRAPPAADIASPVSS